MEISENLYQELLSIDYFIQCGNNIDGLYEFDVYVEKDLDRAIKSLSKTSWSNITLAELNNLTAYLFENHRDCYNSKWNVQAEINRKELIPPIISKLEEKAIRKEIIDDTKWLLMCVLMYDYYSEFGFESELLNQVHFNWKSGHLPCGYSGKYPNGKLRVY